MPRSSWKEYSFNLRRVHKSHIVSRRHYTNKEHVHTDSCHCLGLSQAEGRRIRTHKRRLACFVPCMYIKKQLTKDLRRRTGQCQQLTCNAALTAHLPTVLNILLSPAGELDRETIEGTLYPDAMAAGIVVTKHTSASAIIHRALA